MTASSSRKRTNKNRAAAAIGRHGHNERRARAYFLAEVAMWSARKGFPAETADPYYYGALGPSTEAVRRMIGRAENAAAARVLYRIARAHAMPLP